MAERLAAFGRTLVFLIFVPATVAIFVPEIILSRVPGGAPLVPGLGLVLVALGIVSWFWAGVGFSFVGRGTPSPLDAPRELVVWGPYRWTRNPMYIAVLAVILGVAVATSSLALLAYAVLIFCAFHLFVV